MTDLRISGVRKRRGAAEVLAGIDLGVPHGGIVALLGASGCGKTTLLRLVAGFDRCDAGEIALGGTLVDGGRSFVPPERRGIGYVPQEGLLFPHLTAAGNIGFGLSRAERRGGRIDETLQLVGLEAEMGRRHPHQLSGGQQQRVALARALAPRPRLVLLDEPFNGLDGALRRSVAADVSAVLRKAGTTAVLVTHDPLEAFACADTIAAMREGRIVQHADPIALYRRPADIRVARLTGPTLELRGRVQGGEADTVLGRLPVVAPAGFEGEARILLRPDQVIAAGSAGVPVEVQSAVFGGDHTLVTVLAGQDRLDLRLAGTVEKPLRVAVQGTGLAFAP